MDMPFKLTLLQKGKEYNISIRSQWEDEEDKDGEAPVELVENSSIYLQFRSAHPDVRFYMEGLEMLPEHLVREDEEGRPFLFPSEDQILLCSYDSFPLSPDDYILQVSAGENQFFGRIRIVPGRMSNEQMQVMRNELEGELKGLSFDMDSRTLLGGKKEREGVGFNWFYQLVKNQGSSLVSALHEFASFPRYQMKREYQWQKIEKAGKRDQISFRNLLTSPKKEQVCVPVSVIDYGVPENRWAKYILLQFNKYLLLFLEHMENRKETLDKIILELSSFASTQELRRKRQKLAEVEGMLDVIYPMVHLLSYIQERSWFKEIPLRERLSMPSIMFEDGRYHAIYEIYRGMLERESPLLRWKSTGKLYEIWSFLLLVRTLCSEKMGFQKILGQLSGEGETGIPDLLPGTRFLVEKEDIRLALTYDEPLPRQSVESDSLTRPLYTSGSHNRPDARLDVFVKGMFSGSVLIDFKYRNSFSIWDESMVLSHQRSREMAQLISYGFNARSLYLYGNEAYRFMDPVHEVWVFYPKRVRGKGEVNFPDYKLRLIEVTPGTENFHLVGHLQAAFNQIIERAQKISGQ